MAFDDQMYVYGFFKSSDGEKISNEVCYAIDVYDFLVDNFVEGENLFQSNDDLEENFEKIDKGKLLELIKYLLFFNDFVHNWRYEAESDLFEDSVKAYNPTLDDNKINCLRECYDFEITKAELSAATFEM